MIFNQQTEFINFTRGKSNFTFLPTGDIYEFTYDYFLINGYWGNSIDGSQNNIYLRVYDDKGNLSVYPLLGIKSQSKISVGTNRLVYTGTVEGIDYQVSFLPADEGIWFWQVDLAGDNKTIDLIYGQDIGVAAKGGVLTNELYTSQYLDHKIIKGSMGYTVSSRQNLSQGCTFPYLQQGSLNTEIIGFSTDSTQFFGNEYRKSYVPKLLYKDLPNVNYQFEMAYTALQTRRLALNGKESIVFYGIFKPDQPTAVTELLYQDQIKAAFDNVGDIDENTADIIMPSIRDEFSIEEPFVSDELDSEELNRLFPERRLAETRDGVLLSFFTPGHTHVVLQQKDVLVERPHGHIITTLPDDKEVSYGLVTSTNYMYGIFNSQLVAGNTSFNKLLSTARGFLNILKNSGQRVFVRIDGVYKILTLPAAYEMGVNFAKWYYKLNDDMLIVTSFALADEPAIVFEISSEKGRKYDFVVTNQLVMGEHEYTRPINVIELDNIVHITKGHAEPWDPYADLNYNIHVLGCDYSISDDRIFFAENKSRNCTLLTMTISDASDFQLIFEGRLDKHEITPMGRKNLNTEYDKFLESYKKLFGNIALGLAGKKTGDIEKLNEIIWWYTHDALIHFAVPHGLEQPGGAAWGTRDVCQGPMEFFLTTGHFELARNVLIKIYEHQYLEAGEWPQYFMFDKFDFQAGDWHGDVVFWPLKCIGDYLTATGDTSILYERLCYRHIDTHRKTAEKRTMLEHIKEAVETIKARFVYDTALISYAGGDWDDTLQPADPGMKEKLVSAWTVALAYQVLNQLAQVLKNVDPGYSASLAELCGDIKDSFNKLLIKDDIIAGFAYFKDEKTMEYMLHPDDDKTGIKYRLLPLTRSIIAEIVDKKQAEKNAGVIDAHLTFPDGVRLMDRPAYYEGGVSKYFQRAEQAANVGREISLQYVHAHIRYIEAMAKLGKPEKAWDGLFKINPINIRQAVPNAALRQANTYFSSSEGAFNTRYEYQDNFDRLKDGSIEVKGGWRIYSSGSGIYIRQLVSNILGIRFVSDGLVIDPVLPEELDGLSFDYTYMGKNITFVYHISRQNTETKIFWGGQELKAEMLENPYRSAGVKVDKELILNLLDRNPEIHIRTHQI